MLGITDLSVCYGEPVTVGRSRHSDLWYSDPRVSRTHCRFESVSTNNHTAFDVTVTSTSQNGVWLVRRRAPATNGQRGRHILHPCMRDVPVPIRVGDVLCLRNPLRVQASFHAIYIMSIETTN